MVQHQEYFSFKMDHSYKFRISCRVELREPGESSEFEFKYQLLSEAKANYKSILLGLYRKKDVVGFSICLNRTSDKKWGQAIFREENPSNG